jgi:tetratricopeptide (TPR) repeat protein
LAITAFVFALLSRASFASDTGVLASATERSSIQSAATQSLAEDHPEDAARQLDAWLSVHPDDPDALYLRAIAAQKGGNVAAALLCLNRALLLRPEVEQDTDESSPSKQLSAALGAALLARDSGTSVKPPAWTWPPATVLLIKVPIEELLPKKPITLEPAQVVPATDLVETTILKDPHGQWAEKAKASTEYGSDNYGAVQATGAPDVTSYADNGRAWASASADSQEEWLELTYANAVHATGVRVRQTFNPGAIKQIELYDETGQAHVVWSGVDPARGGRSDIAWFGVKFSPTPFTTLRIRVILDSPAVNGWNEIDTVQLLGE